MPVVALPYSAVYIALPVVSLPCLDDEYNLGQMPHNNTIQKRLNIIYVKSIGDTVAISVFLHQIILFGQN